MNAQYVNLDSVETGIFNRELKHVKTKSYDVLKKPLAAFTLFPVSNEVNAGAETITYEQYESIGIAKIISDYAQDLPRCDIKGREFTSRVKSVGNSYGYSRQDIRAFQLAGKPFQQRKANSAVEAQMRTWNSIAFNGDTEHNLQGLFTNANIPTVSLPADGNSNGGTNSTKLEHKTPQQMVRDLNTIANSIFNATGGVERPDTLVVTPDVYSLIHSTPRSDNSDTTVAEYFLRNNPFINNIQFAIEFEGAGTGGADVTMAYERSPDKLTLEMPMMFTQGMPQEKGLTYEIPCESRIGGLIIYYPLSIAICEDA